MDEKIRLLMDYRLQQMIEWRKIALKLCELYTCDRCHDTICCTITPAALTDEEILKLSQHVKMAPEEFVARYCEGCEAGWIYLRSPCPFLKRGIKNRRYPVCRVHEIRPLVCRRYPFDDIPGVINSTDLCPMASKIENDIKDIQRRLSTGELVIEVEEEDNGLAEKMDALSKEILESKEVKQRLNQVGVEVKQEFNETVKEIIKKMVPDVSGRPSRNVKAHPGLFVILLEEKNNSLKL